jgi:MoxR-like ATPase
VLLIDELDRADEPFEAFLLEILADFQLSIPELGTVRAGTPPVVVITSNRTREVHDAIRRRCLYHWVDYPDPARERAILRVRAPGVDDRLSAQVVAFVQAVRCADTFKPPGVAETIDWAAALAALDARELEPGAGGRDAGRAAEVPGRHREDPRRRGGAAGDRGEAGGG